MGLLERIDKHLNEQTNDGWIGVDLDGTLAEYNGWEGIEHIGKPIPKMMNRVKNWLDNGQQVKIFTARVSEGNKAIKPILDWLSANDLPKLDITNVKDMKMIELWDDRCKQVEINTGNVIGGE